MKDQTYKDIQKAFKALEVWDEFMYFCNYQEEHYGVSKIHISDIKKFHDLIEKEKN